MKYRLLIIMGLLLCGRLSFAGEVNGWRLTWGKPETTALLELEEEVETYTGDMMMHRMRQEAPAGHVFYLLPITVSRAKSDAAPFHAAKITLHVGERAFTRLEDDAFLIDYGKVPFTHLKMKLGTHQGMITFVVPENLKNKDFTLTYDNQPVQGD